MSNVDNSGADALAPAPSAAAPPVEPLMPAQLAQRIVRDEYTDGTFEQAWFAQDPGDDGMKLKQKKFRNGDVEFYEGNDERLVQRDEAEGTVKRLKGQTKREWIAHERQEGGPTRVYGGVPPNVFTKRELNPLTNTFKIFTRVGLTSESVCNREVRDDGEIYVRRGEGYEWKQLNVPAEHLRPPTPPPPPPTAAELAARERERRRMVAAQSAASRHARDSWADQNQGNAPMRVGRLSEVDVMDRRALDQANS